MRIGIGIGIGARLGGGGAFALSNAQWTVIERPEDANRKRPQVDVYAEPPAGTRFLASRTANANGIPTSGNFAELTFVGVGHYRWQGSSQVTSAEEQIVVWTVASDVSAPVPTMVLGAPNPAVTRVSLNKPFQPSGVPFAPAFTYYADGSGTAVQIRLSPRAVNEGNGRNGVTPWRAVDQLRWRIGAGADTTISDADTIDLTGLSASQSVTIAAHNVNGWGPDQTVTVLAELPALGPGDWTLTDAGDGANLLAAISAGLVSPSGAAAEGYLHELDAGAADDLDPGGAIPASVGSHDVILRGVFDLGIGMPSDEKTASVAALSTFPSLVGTPASGSDTGTTRNITFTNAIGNLLCLVISPDGTSDLGSPAGWEKVSPGTLRDPSLHVYFKKASSVNEVVTITSASEAVQWFPIVITDWLDTGTITDTLVIGSIAENYGASTLTLDAPSVTNTHGTEKVLWMLLVANSGLYPAQTSAPSGWTGFQSDETGTLSSDARVGICFRQEEIATMDPAAWPTATRIAMTRVIGIRPGAGASAVALSGASLTISPESPVETDTATFAFSFSAGTTPATTSLTINGVTTTTTTGTHTRTLPAGSYPYTWSSSNAAGAGPSGSGTLVVAAAPTITASVSLSPSSPTAGQTVTATVTVSPTDATPGLSVVNGGSSVSITSTGANTWTFTAPATGTTTVTPTATLDATVVSGTPATFSTGAAPVSANAPKLWGVPEVGDLLEFIAGTGVSSPSYLIERTDNGGSTYATEKTATAGEFFVVPNQVGRQYRAVMVAPDTTRTVGAWTEPVAAAGPQIAVASVDGRTLAVQTPDGTGTLRARPYGGGTAITAAVSGTTTNITLTGNGCWQIDYAPDGVTFGALAYRWCWTVGVASVFGRNVAAIHPFDDIIVPELIPGRQGTQDAITPVTQSETAALVHAPSITVTYYTNGAVEDFESALLYSEQGHAAWDNRCFTDSGGNKTIARRNATETAQSFDIANLVTKYPRMLTPGMGHIKCVSKPDSVFLGEPQGHRQGLPEQFVGVAPMASAPGTNDGPPQLMRHPSWSAGYVNYSGLDALIAKFQAKQFASAGMGITQADADGIMDRITRYNPALGAYRGGWHESDSHERLTVYRSGWPFGESNYYFGRVFGRAALLASTDFCDNAWIARAITAMAHLGTQIDIPGKEAQVGAGISIHHELPIIISRIARGLSFTDLPSSQPGNYTGMMRRFTSGDVAKLSPHTDYALPYFSFWSDVVAFVPELDTAGNPVPAGTYWLYVRARTQDGSKQRFDGFNILRQSHMSNLVPVIANGDADTFPGAAAAYGRCYRLRVNPALFSPTPVAGEKVSFDAPTDIKALLQIGYDEWDYSADPETGTYLNRYYNPTSATSYRDRQYGYGLSWALRVADAFPGTEPWTTLEKYNARCALSNYPGTGNWNHPFNEGGWFLNVWNAYAASLGITTS